MNRDSPIMVDFFGNYRVSRTETAEVKLQGTRPAALEVNRSSAIVNRQAARQRDRCSPVVVYLQSPKVVHVRPEEFMEMVQQLTGNRSTGSSESLPPASFL
ncbi:hypothetical protein SAY87_001336 [Trapa incisa]|uniref:VQ domain-containing protein n=2 Tax=Trapa TaxID=22665 RepID=A0AAN7LP46_TRANT|nr:hypothetical protein SAY87_001336 [Trapa incisa]KAK4790031.1 hypothetical protein SAY86_017335 [Trapa natans]